MFQATSEAKPGLGRLGEWGLRCKYWVFIYSVSQCYNLVPLMARIEESGGDTLDYVCMISKQPNSVNLQASSSPKRISSRFQSCGVTQATHHYGAITYANMYFEASDERQSRLATTVTKQATSIRRSHIPGFSRPTPHCVHQIRSDDCRWPKATVANRTYCISNTFSNVLQ